MSYFIGISLQDELPNEAYESALSQIEDYVAQTPYKILPHHHILILANEYQKFYLPKNSNFLHSNLQSFIVSHNTDQEYIETIIECLMILKQHFPHKIEIEMISDLPLIFNLKHKVAQQIPRRLISRIKALQTSKKILNQEDVSMLIQNLIAQFHKDYKQKLKSLSLKVLAEGKIDPKIWSDLSNQQVKIIDEVANDPLNQKVGIEILQKIVRNNDYRTFSFSEQKENMSPNYKESQYIQQQKLHFDGPLDPMTALFQLRQTLNLNRVSWIIENIDFTKLDQKKAKKFDTRIKQIAEKFSKGFYQNYSPSQAKNFGRTLSQYQMKRENLEWGGLIQQVLMKIEDDMKSNKKIRQ